MNKQEAKKLLRNLSFNKEYKTIADTIINNVPDDRDIRSYYDFIINRVGLGLQYDVSPELSVGHISYVIQNKHKSINITDFEKEEKNEHKVIIGENYEALKNLVVTHSNKVDIIYIDPPYNTESTAKEGNSSYKDGKSKYLVYKDKFDHTAWINFMRDRLHLANKLLSNNGIIFISIDDNEQNHLKILCDYIFNFIGVFPRTTSTGRNTIKKSIKNTKPSKNKNFTVKIDYLLVYSKKNENLSYEESLDFLNVEKSFQDEFMFMNFLFQNSKKELSNLGLEFSFPKVTSFIKQIIKLVPKNENSIILDFFAGSGTTGHAVMKLNQEDGGNRKFILCTNNENEIANKVLIPRLKMLITGKSLTDDEKVKKYLSKHNFLSEKVRVFDLKREKIKYEGYIKNEWDSFEQEAKTNLKLLNSAHTLDSNFSLYYDLSGINLDYEKGEDL